jgi:hypothetical protein
LRLDVRNSEVHGGASVPVLFVRDGLLVQIERFAYDEPWADDIGKYDIVGLLVD